MKTPSPIDLTNDEEDSIGKILFGRTPFLAIGLLLGFVISFAASQFEEVLAKDIEVAFFIPLIVYIAAAVGAQTQAIYIRDLSRGVARFSTYVIKESIIGIMLGILFGVATYLIVFMWFGSPKLALAIGLSVMATVGIAPLVAVGVVEILELKHKDPALGAGPISTVIQDTISVVVYGLIASAIILGT